MNIEEYYKAISEIDLNAKKEKEKLGHKYAFEHKQYDIGDIIETNTDRIIIENIRWCSNYFGNTIPQCIYIGSDVTKKLEINKRGRINSRIYESEKITLLKKKE